MTLYPESTASAEPAPVRECRGMAEIKTSWIASNLPSDTVSPFPGVHDERFLN